MSNLANVFALLVISVLAVEPASAEGDALRGARVFNACASCHSIQPEEHMTGPSLAGV